MEFKIEKHKLQSTFNLIYQCTNLLDFVLYLKKINKSCRVINYLKLQIVTITTIQIKLYTNNCYILDNINLFFTDK